MIAKSATLLTSFVVLAGCGSGASGGHILAPELSSPGPVGSVSAAGVPAFSGQAPQAVTMIAPSVDAVQSRVAPAPINGGTLIVTKDGLDAVAADPDRNRVVIVDLKGAQVLATIQLETGDEPGHLVEDGTRQVHVVLRRSGDLATISLDDRKLSDRRHVCPTPQGIDYDANADSILVACTSGELVTLPASGGAASRSVHVDFDLRDVIVFGKQLFVTRFKSAELLELDAAAAVISRRTLDPIQGPQVPDLPGPDQVTTRTFAPAVAWRAIATSNGSIAMLHQRAQIEPVELHSTLNPQAGADAGAPMDCGSGCAGTASPPTPAAPPGFASKGGGSAYGGLAPCDSIVQSSVSTLGTDGSKPVSGPMLANVTLAVDTAVSPNGLLLAVGIAGNSNNFSGPFANAPSPIGPASVLLLPARGGAVDSSIAGTCLEPSSVTNGAISAGQVTAVAFDGANRLVIQTRDPNRIRVVDPSIICIDCGAQFTVDVDMGGEARRDAGHDLFHMNAGAGLACASCHPGGGDDGRTWAFKEIGPRRTQLFNMGIRDTLPLHWDGELPTFQALIEEVFERRMGGPVLDPQRIQMMSDWVESLHPGAPMREGDDEAAARGKMLFESAKVGCTSCHNGPKLTNNTSVDVGTGGTFQVPSLIGVAYHQPYMHSGCAQNLRQRFDPACGGAKHGNTANLKESQLGDLVAYLESL